MGAGSLWVGHQSDRQVWRLDRRTGKTAAKVSISDAARGIGFGGGLVWVTTETGLISIDPRTNKVIRTIDLIERTPDEGPIGVALIGAGKFGSMFLAQVPHMPGIAVRAIADLRPEGVAARLAGLLTLPMASDT